jgi:hypothetical protein
MSAQIPTQKPFFATLSSGQSLILNNCTSLSVYSAGGVTNVATDTQTLPVQDGISLEMSPNSPYSFSQLTITAGSGATAYVVYLQ